MPYPFGEWPILATIALFVLLIIALAYGSWVTRDIDLIAKTNEPSNDPQ